MRAEPILVFPSQGGRFHEYEDFGMIEACRGSIDAGKVRFFAVDSVDYQSWVNWGAHPADRGPPPRGLRPLHRA